MRSFFGFGQKAYIGSPYIRPISLAGIDGICVPLLFQWFSYGASTAKPVVNVLVDMRNQSVAVKLRKIKSVYIDNMGSNNPVYVYFPDTGYTVVAQPNSAGWFPVYTNDLVLWVIGEGFLTGDIPQSSVLVTNLNVAPAIDLEIATQIPLWKASNTISRGSTLYNTNYGVPTLGDQVRQVSFNVTVPAVLPVFNVQSSGFYYINYFQLYGVSLANTPNALSMAMFFESTGVAGNLFTFPIYVPGAVALSNSALGTQDLGTISGVNLKIDATQTWQLRNNATPSSGTIVAMIGFTYNPT